MEKDLISKIIDGFFGFFSGRKTSNKAKLARIEKRKQTRLARIEKRNKKKNR